MTAGAGRSTTSERVGPLAWVVTRIDQPPSTCMVDVAVISAGRMAGMTGRKPFLAGTIFGLDGREAGRFGMRTCGFTCAIVRTGRVAPRKPETIDTGLESLDSKELTTEIPDIPATSDASVSDGNVVSKTRASSPASVLHGRNRTKRDRVPISLAIPEFGVAYLRQFVHSLTNPGDVLF